MKYWVEFDEPQYDGAGGGPYRKAQIWDQYLVRDGGATPGQAPEKS